MTSPIDLLAFSKERNIVSVLDNEDVCKRLYPFVPEMFRSPAGLKRIVADGQNLKDQINSPSYRKVVSEFQECLSYFTTDVALVGGEQ